MSSHVIEKTVIIAAPATAVWELIVSPALAARWAEAFSEGTYVESDFRAGSEVNWKDKDGNTGARGVVTARREMELLEVAFFDDVNPDLKQQPGQYKERYALSSEGGKTKLAISAGPLAEEHYKVHEPLWTAALEKIKSLAEQAVPARGMDA
jgi:uncharacterized protein YndB with AHSA1/START domain